LFRFFDIVKPWPVSWADKEVPGAFGVMLDDVLAGLLACLVLQVSLLTIPSLGPLLG
jgi:phosphatidylglycerophosphatase A